MFCFIKLAVSKWPNNATASTPMQIGLCRQKMGNLYLGNPLHLGVKQLHILHSKGQTKNAISREPLVLHFNSHCQSTFKGNFIDGPDLLERERWRLSARAAHLTRRFIYAACVPHIYRRARALITILAAATLFYHLPLWSWGGRPAAS
jgi:hypothetical protein